MSRILTIRTVGIVEHLVLILPRPIVDAAVAALGDLLLEPQFKIIGHSFRGESDIAARTASLSSAGFRRRGGYQRQHEVRWPLAVVVDRLVGGHLRRLQADVVGAGVQVPQVQGIVAAGYLDPNPVPFQENIARGAPELDQVLVDLAWFDLAKLGRVERTAPLGVTASRPKHAVAKQSGVAVG